MKEEYKDEELICIDCSKPFIFTAGEQSFFYSKGLQPPKRCASCRKTRKESISREVR